MQRYNSQHNTRQAEHNARFLLRNYAPPKWSRRTGAIDEVGSDSPCFLT